MKKIILNIFLFIILSSCGYSPILTQNIQDFNDLALGFGYVNENNQGDIKNFLENCLVRVENFTKIIIKIYIPQMLIVSIFQIIQILNLLILIILVKVRSHQIIF